MNKLFAFIRDDDGFGSDCFSVLVTLFTITKNHFGLKLTTNENKKAIFFLDTELFPLKEVPSMSIK